MGKGGVLDRIFLKAFFSEFEYVFYVFLDFGGARARIFI